MFSCSYRNISSVKDVTQKLHSSNLILPTSSFSDDTSHLSSLLSSNRSFDGWHRTMSTSRGKSMRSKVERRMQKESGKTLREIRRAKKIKKKLMTDEERLIYNLKRVNFYLLTMSLSLNSLYMAFIFSIQLRGGISKFARSAKVRVCLGAFFIEEALCSKNFSCRHLYSFLINIAKHFCK